LTERLVGVGQPATAKITYAPLATSKIDQAAAGFAAEREVVSSAFAGLLWQIRGPKGGGD